MTLETKYSIGDKVWVMLCGRPEALTVRQISVKLDRWHTFGSKTESYYLADGRTAFCHNEWYGSKLIYSTRDELLKSL